MAEKYKVPEEGKGEIALPLAKAGLSVLPIVGAPAAELLGMLVQPLLDKRRILWMRQVSEGLRDLEKNGLRLEGLADNEQFVSVAVQASQIAMRTHLEEKRQALANAILNVASAQAPDESLQLMFLSLVDLFTEWHIRLLRLFQAPPQNAGVVAGALEHVLQKAYPELRDKRAFYDAVWKDLFLRGLTGPESLHVMMTGPGLAQKQTSGLGDSFLAFISAPQGVPPT